MDRGLAVLLTARAGGLIALQAPINAGLGKSTGSLPAALVSFVVGTVALAAIVVLSGKAGGLGSTFDVSWYYLLGGLLGAVYVANALIAVTAIGAGGVAAATITGQLTASVAIDRLGLFGLDQIPLTPERVARRRPAAGRHRPRRSLRRRGELRRRDPQVVAEGPVDEPLVAEHADQRAEQARRDPRHQPLHAQHPAELPLVRVVELGVARRRLPRGPGDPRRPRAAPVPGRCRSRARCGCPRR